MIEAVLLRPFRAEDPERFRGLEGYHFTRAEKPGAEELAAAEVMLGLPTAAEIAVAPRLRWIQLTNAGADNYSRGRMELPAGVTLTNLSGAFGQSISEYVLAMTLMLYKNLQIYRDQQREHRWQDVPRQESPVGKRLLILGAGDIGTAIARRFRPFGCHVTGVRRSVGALPPEFDAIITTRELDELLPRSDIVACALPSTPETRGLLDRRRLRLLKPTALLLNVGRGDLIDTEALTELLREGRLLGAGLDVTDPEPLSPDHPLWDCPNAIITPHATGGSFGHLPATEEALFAICRENLRRYAGGLPLLNRVDPVLGCRVAEDRWEK